MCDPENNAKAMAIKEALVLCNNIYMNIGPHIGTLYGLVAGDYLIDLRKKKNDERKRRMNNKIAEKIQKQNIKEIRYISPKYSYPMVINTILEEDDYLQDIWCQLIANAMDSDFNLEIRFAYIDIIKNLTPLDAKVLKLAYDEVSRMVDNADFTKEDYKNTCMINIVADLEIINKQLNVSEEELRISSNNLERVQCFRYGGSQNSLIVGKHEIPPIMANGPMHVTLTSLGIAFIETCMK